MKKSNLPAVAINTQMSAAINVDNSDVVAIMVSRAEEILVSQRKDIEKEIKSLTEEIRTIEKQQIEIVNGLKDKYEKAESTMIKSLEKDGFKDVAVVVTLAEQTKEKRFNVTININQKSTRYGTSGVTKYTKIQTPKQILNGHDRVNEIRETMRKLAMDLYEADRKLEEIPREERKAKAQIATAVLSQSKEGRAMLKKLGV